MRCVARVTCLVGEGGGHNRTVKVCSAMARELCTPGL